MVLTFLRGKWWATKRNLGKKMQANNLACIFYSLRIFKRNCH